MSPADVEKLLTTLGTGLNVFVGKFRSGQLLDELRAQLLADD